MFFRFFLNEKSNFCSGIATLTFYEENYLVEQLINHPSGEELTLDEAQMFFDQIVMKISRMNYSHEMAFVQKEFFYDFLLKNPHIVLKHRQWFENYEESLMPSANDLIQLKKWQLATLLRGHSVVEQRFV